VVHQHHLLRKGATQLLHFHVVFAEHVFEDAAALHETAIALGALAMVVRVLVRSLVVYLFHVGLLDGLGLVDLALAPRSDHPLDDLVVLHVDAYAWLSG